MAATVNLPVAQKIPPASDKVATDVNASSRSGNGDFSRALHQQMNKQQSSSASQSGDARAKVDNSHKKQSVSDDSSTPKEAAKASEAEAGKPAVANTDTPRPAQDDGAKADPIDAGILASMQVPVMQPDQLRELIAQSLQAGNGEESGGNILPQVASLDPAQSKLADIMNMLGMRANSNPQANPGAGEDTESLPQGLLMLQQRIQQQLAAQSQDQDVADSPSLDVKQLKGLETALAALAKASEKGDGKGLTEAREQLLNRLQALQSTQSGQSADSGQAAQDDELSGLIKSVREQLVAGQSGQPHGAGEDKMAKVAFQELMGKLTPQAKPADMNATQAGNNSALLHAGLSGVTAGSSSPSQQAMQFMPPSTTVNVPVHDQAWGQAIGERLQWMVKQDMNQAEIKLNPRHLGPIEVKISMQQDQATVSFSAHHVVTRDALENAMPRLREMFGDSGLNLIDVNVSHHSDSQGQQSNTDGERGQQGMDWPQVDTLTANDGLGTEMRTSPWITSNRMLDTYV